MIVYAVFATIIIVIQHSRALKRDQQIKEEIISLGNRCISAEKRYNELYFEFSREFTRKYSSKNIKEGGE